MISDCRCCNQVTWKIGKIDILKFTVASRFSKVSNNAETDILTHFQQMTKGLDSLNHSLKNVR